MSNRDGMSNSGHSVSLGLQFRLDIPSRLGVPSRWTFRLAGQLTVWKFRLVGHSVSMDIQALNRHTLPQKTFCSRGVRIRIARYRVHEATTAKQQMHAVRVRPQRSPCLRLLCSLVIQRIYIYAPPERDYADYFVKSTIALFLHNWNCLCAS